MFCIILPLPYPKRLLCLSALRTRARVWLQPNSVTGLSSALSGVRPRVQAPHKFPTAFIVSECIPPQGHTWQRLGVVSRPIIQFL